MAELDPFEAYKRAQEAKKREESAPRKPAPPPAPKPKVERTNAPAPDRPTVPALKPRPKPAPAPAPKAAPTPAPAAERTPDAAAADAPKARGLVRHRFAKADLMKMGDDRDFEAQRPDGMQDTSFDPDVEAEMESLDATAGSTEVAPPSKLVRGGFHQDDAAAMKATDDADDDEAAPARPHVVKHMFHQDDLRKMGDDRNFDPPPPAGIESTRIGAGVGDPDAEETDEEAAERRRRRYGEGLMGSQRAAQGAAPDWAREEGDDGGEDGDAAVEPAE